MTVQSPSPIVQTTSASAIEKPRLGMKGKG